MTSVDQASPSKRAAAFHADGMQRQFREREDSRERHHKARRDDVIGDPVCGGLLLYVESEPVFAFSQMFDIVQPGYVCILHDVRLRKRSQSFLFHCDSLPTQLGNSPFPRVYDGICSPLANHERSEAGYAIAPLDNLSSVPASRKKLAEFCSQTASRGGGHNPPAHDAPLVSVIHPSCDPDRAVEPFDNRARGENVGHRGRLGEGLVLSHFARAA